MRNYENYLCKQKHISVGRSLSINQCCAQYFSTDQYYFHLLHFYYFYT